MNGQLRIAKKLSARWFVGGLTLLLLLDLGACCTKKACDWPAPTNKIEFYNFSDDEIDSVAIESFTANSSFGSRIDSSFAVAIMSNGPPPYVFMSTSVDTKRDYRITLLSTGQTFAITGFETVKKKCNSCFPYTPSKEYYYVIVSYLVNGQKQAFDYFALSITQIGL